MPELPGRLRYYVPDYRYLSPVDTQTDGAQKAGAGFTLAHSHPQFSQAFTVGGFLPPVVNPENPRTV